MMLSHTLFFVLGVVCYHAVTHAVAYEVCSNQKTTEDSTGICPNGNTCCRMADGKSWGCISSDMGQYNATCCEDDFLTGCPVGYTCRTAQHDCMALSNESSELHADPLTQVLPRYRLCNAKEIPFVYGFPVNTSGSNNSKYAEIPYYSNMGAFESVSTNVSHTVDMALIVVHGATRNGDDYFCSAKATVELQDRFTNVLIIALNFYSVTDVRPRDSLLCWDSGDTDGKWRYGADSLEPIHYSSFAVLDQIVLQVQQQFTNLQRITVAGHSSGGQLVQRWALLSNVTHDDTGSSFQVVVANPSNYVYLTQKRFIRGSWTIPSNDFSCSEYDQWEWGLQNGGKGDVPYRDRTLATNVSAVLERFKSRHVYYLVGGVDRCNVSESGSSGWCQSHGLETKCMDQLQGRNRYERNARYMSSLRRLGFSNENHRRVVVPGVGHDHSMMFQSPNGIRAIYYEMPSVKAEQLHGETA